MTTPLKWLLNALLRIANSAKATVIAFFAIVISCSVIYSALEDKNVGDSIWWAVVTASTVGYGDTYPTTAAGRILAGTLISTMVLLVIPLITAHFASKLIVDQDAFRHDEQEEIKANLRAIRASMERLEAAGVLPPPLSGDSSDRSPAP